MERVSDERPPYHAFFSDNKSKDIVLKVIFNIFSFIGIIICVAWVNSLRSRARRKHYIKPISFSDFASLFEPDAVSKLSSIPNLVSGYTPVSLRLGSRTVAVISSWAKIEEFRNELKFTKYFTKCQDSFCSDWQGLLFSDPFSVDHLRLREFFDFASQNLSADLYIEAAAHGVDYFLKPLPSKMNLTDSDVNRLLLTILFQTILHRDLDKKTSGAIIAKLGELSQALLILHTTGRLPEPFQSFGIKWLTQSISQLTEPLILFDLDRNRNCPPKTLLSHLLAARQKLSPLEVKNKDIEGFLSTKHLGHLLFECIFIGHHSLLPCLRIIFEAFQKRSVWAQRLAEDLTDHRRTCPYVCRKHAADLTEDCLQLYSGCLPFCKDLSLEALRFVVAGWPMGCASESYRDGDGYLAGDVVLINEPAVFHDDSLWFNEKPLNARTHQCAFLPLRRHGSTSADYLATRILLNSKVGFLPRIHLYRILLATIVHLFTRCSMRSEFEINEEFANLPLYLSANKELGNIDLHRNDL
ncbi:hypothetical protein Aperf_G00000076239 [Anoplocephala perfoliata]